MIRAIGRKNDFGRKQFERGLDFVVSDGDLFVVFRVGFQFKMINERKQERRYGVHCGNHVTAVGHGANKWRQHGDECGDQYRWNDEIIQMFLSIILCFNVEDFLAFYVGNEGVHFADGFVGVVIAINTFLYFLEGQFLVDGFVFYVD